MIFVQTSVSLFDPPTPLLNFWVWEKPWDFSFFSVAAVRVVNTLFRFNPLRPRIGNVAWPLPFFP